MKFLFDFVQLELVKRKNLQSILDAIQSQNEVEIEVDAIEFPDKIRIELNIWLDGCLFTFEPVVVWDDKRLGYCGLSKYIEDCLASRPGLPELEEWLSAQLQKSFM